MTQTMLSLKVNPGYTLRLCDNVGSTVRLQRLLTTRLSIKRQVG